MAERVHPHDSYSHTPPSSPPRSPDLESPRKPRLPSDDKPIPHPTPGTYVVQIPKDQIYRVPPPARAGSLRRRAKGKPQGLRRCCCCFVLVVLALVSLIAAAAGVFYLVVKPEAPDYSIDSISFQGLNLTSTSTSTSVSPAIDVAVRANNPNDKIGIYYLGGSAVEVYYTDMKLGDGALREFYQPANNVTVFDLALKGGALALTSEVRGALVSGESQGGVPLTLKVKAPVKLKVGALRTWKITVKVTCQLTVDKLTATAKIESRQCDYGVNVFQVWK